MTFTTVSFMAVSILVLVHSLWFELPSRWIYSMLVFLTGLYALVTFPVGNFVFATGLIVMTFVLCVGAIFYYYFVFSKILSLRIVFFAVVIFLVLVFLSQPFWWIFQLHSSCVGTEFSGGYTTGGHLLDGVTGADLKGLIFVGVAAYAVAHLHGREGKTQPLGLESLVLAIIAVCAGLITFNVDNLVVLYLNLELQALALYTLVGYNKDRPTVVDSSLRYLLAGSLISGITLIGFVQVYGVNGTFQLSQVHFGGGTGTIWILGMLLFKLGAAPFYFWTPTVYQPLDLPTLALVVGPAKINLWYLLVVVLSPVTADSSSYTQLLLVVGLLSITVGAVGGYFQTSVTSLLAYSGVLNTGYLLLLAISEGPSFNFSFYLAIYMLSTVSVVVVLSLLPGNTLQGYSFTTRLGKVTPLTLYYLMLNLAGLPVFPGFFAKFYLVEGVLHLGWVTVAVVVIFSIVPGLYYVGVAAQPLFVWSQEENKNTQPGKWSSVAAAVTLISVTAAAGFRWQLRVY